VIHVELIRIPCMYRHSSTICRVQLCKPEWWKILASGPQFNYLQVHNSIICIHSYIIWLNKFDYRSSQWQCNILWNFLSRPTTNIFNVPDTDLFRWMLYYTMQLYWHRDIWYMYCQIGKMYTITWNRHILNFNMKPSFF
jgi:hypothetical protein